MSIKLSTQCDNTHSPYLDPNQTVNTIRQHTFTLSRFQYTCPSNCQHNTTTHIHPVLIPIYLSIKLSSQYDHTLFPCLNPQSTCPSNFQHITATHLHPVFIPIYLSIKLSTQYGNTSSPCLDSNIPVHQTVNTIRQRTFTIS